MSHELQPKQRVDASDEQAIYALHQLFFVCERLDLMAHDPPSDGMVKVTAIMWRDMISPWIATIRDALDRAKS